MSLCIWANCSPDVNARSHLITLHSDVGVGVQVNLSWVRISSKIKNILIGWQSWLAVWFQSDCAISNGPGPPTDECLMEICLKDTSSLEILETCTFCICKHAQTIGKRERKSKFITVTDGGLMQRVFEVTERARFPLRTPSDCFLLYFTLAELRCSLGNHNIHSVGIFTQCLSECLNCLTEQIKRSNSWNNYESSDLVQQAHCHSS